MSLQVQAMQSDLYKAAMLDLAARTISTQEPWNYHLEVDERGRAWWFLCWDYICSELLPNGTTASKALARTAAQDLTGGIGRFDVALGRPVMLEAVNGPVLICESSDWPGLWFSNPSDRTQVITKGFATTIPTKPRQKGPCPDAISMKDLAAFLPR